ncbi:MAG: hypothetical protein IPJ88_18935 [Myxococcales bacterium]|nr:MAG: hypothetical protein IPJ88_18935 [Myxococcales bacterium]
MSKWRAMIEPLGAVTSVKLHHTLAVPDSNVGAFDAVTFGPDGNALHVIERIAVGSAESVRAFVARLSSAAAAPRSKLAGGILVAPRFDDHALDAYGEALRFTQERAAGGARPSDAPRGLSHDAAGRLSCPSGGRGR